MPAASEERGQGPTGLPALPRRYRPFGVRIATVVLGLVLFVTLAVVWESFTDDTREKFSLLQRLTLVLFGVATAAILHALGRSRVDATEEGVVVVNGYRTYRYEWSEVLALSLRPGAPWMVMDLADGTSRAAMAVQGSDGRRAATAVGELRRLVADRSRPR